MSAAHPEGLPTTIKVGFVDYLIESWEPKTAAGAHRYGECSHLDQAIRVDFSHDARQSAHTLLHEIMHAASRLQDVEDGLTEEQFVSRVSNGLATIWRDNPAVLAWISEKLTAA